MLLSKRSLLAFVAAGSLAVLAGCTVKPLYGGGDDVGARALLKSVAVANVVTRDAQEVRNHLLFKLYGGGAAPASPDHMVTLKVAAASSAVATVERQRDENGRVIDAVQPSAAILRMSVSYEMKDVATGEIVGTGKAFATASYDVSLQSFTADRAKREATDRAAREVAERIYLSIASKLAR